MSLKQELQKLNDRLEKYRQKRILAEQQDNPKNAAQFQHEIDRITKKVEQLKSKQTRQRSKEGGDIKSLPFNRAITKVEQTDMGKLKKSVRGLIVAHPMTALGREIGIKVVTGFAPKEF
jgi:ribosome-associated protein